MAMKNFLDQLLYFWEKIFSNIYFKIVNLIVLIIIFEWWYLNNFNEEALIALILSLSFMFSSIITDQIKISKLVKENELLKNRNEMELEALRKEDVDKEQKKKVDRKTFQKFMEILPTEGSINLLRYHDFGGAFDLNELSNLRQFRTLFNNAENNFMNKEIDSKKNDLLNLIDKFLYFISMNTFPSGVGLQSIPPEWEIKQPERYEKLTKELNNNADEIAKAHQQFIVFTRNKLNI